MRHHQNGPSFQVLQCTCDASVGARPLLCREASSLEQVEATYRGRPSASPFPVSPRRPSRRLAAPVPSRHLRLHATYRGALRLAWTILLFFACAASREHVWWGLRDAADAGGTTAAQRPDVGKPSLGWWCYAAAASEPHRSSFASPTLPVTFEWEREGEPSSSSVSDTLVLDPLPPPPHLEEERGPAEGNPESDMMDCGASLRASRTATPGQRPKDSEEKKAQGTADDMPCKAIHLTHAPYDASAVEADDHALSAPAFSLSSGHTASSLMPSASLPSDETEESWAAQRRCGPRPIRITKSFAAVNREVAPHDHFSIDLTRKVQIRWKEHRGGYPTLHELFTQLKQAHQEEQQVKRACWATLAASGRCCDAAKTGDGDHGRTGGADAGGREAADTVAVPSPARCLSSIPQTPPPFPREQPDPSSPTPTPECRALPTLRTSLDWVRYLPYIPVLPIEEAIKHLEHEKGDEVLLALFYAPDLFNTYNYVQWMALMVKATCILLRGGVLTPIATVDGDRVHAGGGTVPSRSTMFCADLVLPPAEGLFSVADKLHMRAHGVRIALVDGYYPKRNVTLQIWQWWGKDRQSVDAHAHRHNTRHGGDVEGGSMVKKEEEAAAAAEGRANKKKSVPPDANEAAFPTHSPYGRSPAPVSSPPPDTSPAGSTASNGAPVTSTSPSSSSSSPGATSTPPASGDVWSLPLTMEVQSALLQLLQQESELPEEVRAELPSWDLDAARRGRPGTDVEAVSDDGTGEFRLPSSSLSTASASPRESDRLHLLARHIIACCNDAALGCPSHLLATLQASLDRVRQRKQLLAEKVFSRSQTAKYRVHVNVSAQHTDDFSSTFVCDAWCERFWHPGEGSNAGSFDEDKSGEEEGDRDAAAVASGHQAEGGSRDRSDTAHNLPFASPPQQRGRQNGLGGGRETTKRKREQSNERQSSLRMSAAHESASALPSSRRITGRNLHREHHTQDATSDTTLSTAATETSAEVRPFAPTVAGEADADTTPSIASAPTSNGSHGNAGMGQTALRPVFHDCPNRGDYKTDLRAVVGLPQEHRSGGDDSEEEETQRLGCQQRVSSGETDKAYHREVTAAAEDDDDEEEDAKLFFFNGELTYSRDEFDDAVDTHSAAVAENVLPAIETVYVDGLDELVSEEATAPTTPASLACKEESTAPGVSAAPYTAAFAGVTGSRTTGAYDGTTAGVAETAGSSAAMAEPPVVSETSAAPSAINASAPPSPASFDNLRLLGAAARRNYLLRQKPPVLLFPRKQGSRPYFFPQTLLRLVHLNFPETPGQRPLHEHAVQMRARWGCPPPSFNASSVSVSSSSTWGEESGVTGAKDEGGEVHRTTSTAPPSSEADARVTPATAPLTPSTYRVVSVLDNPFSRIGVEHLHYDFVINGPPTPSPVVQLLVHEAQRVSSPGELASRSHREMLYQQRRLQWLAERQRVAEEAGKCASDTAETTENVYGADTVHPHVMPGSKGAAPTASEPPGNATSAMPRPSRGSPDSVTGGRTPVDGSGEGVGEEADAHFCAEPTPAYLDRAYHGHGDPYAAQVCPGDAPSGCCVGGRGTSATSAQQEEKKKGRQSPTEDQHDTQSSHFLHHVASSAPPPLLPSHRCASAATTSRMAEEEDEEEDFFFEHDASFRLDPDRFVESAPLTLNFFLRTPAQVIEEELVHPLQVRVTELRQRLIEEVMKEVRRYGHCAIVGNRYVQLVLHGAEVGYHNSPAPVLQTENGRKRWRRRCKDSGDTRREGNEDKAEGDGREESESDVRDSCGGLEEARLVVDEVEHSGGGGTASVPYSNTVEGQQLLRALRLSAALRLWRFSASLQHLSAINAQATPSNTTAAPSPSSPPSEDHGKPSPQLQPLPRDVASVVELLHRPYRVTVAQETPPAPLANESAPVLNADRVEVMGEEGGGGGGGMPFILSLVEGREGGTPGSSTLYGALAALGAQPRSLPALLHLERLVLLQLAFRLLAKRTDPRSAHSFSQFFAGHSAAAVTALVRETSPTSVEGSPPLARCLAPYHPLYLTAAYLFFNGTAERHFRAHPLNQRRVRLAQRLDEAVRLSRQARLILLTATEEDQRAQYVDTLLRDAFRRIHVLRPRQHRSESKVTRKEQHPQHHARRHLGPTPATLVVEQRDEGVTEVGDTPRDDGARLAASPPRRDITAKGNAVDDVCVDRQGRSAYLNASAPPSAEACSTGWGITVEGAKPGQQNESNCFSQQPPSSSALTPMPSPCDGAVPDGTSSPKDASSEKSRRDSFGCGVRSGVGLGTSGRAHLKTSMNDAVKGDPCPFAGEDGEGKDMELRGAQRLTKGAVSPQDRRAPPPQEKVFSGVFRRKGIRDGAAAWPFGGSSDGEAPYEVRSAAEGDWDRVKADLGTELPPVTAPAPEGVPREEREPPLGEASRRSGARTESDAIRTALDLLPLSSVEKARLKFGGAVGEGACNEDEETEGLRCPSLCSDTSTWDTFDGLPWPSHDEVGGEGGERDESSVGGEQASELTVLPLLWRHEGLPKQERQRRLKEYYCNIRELKRRMAEATRQRWAANGERDHGRAGHVAEGGAGG